MKRWLVVLVSSLMLGSMPLGLALADDSDEQDGSGQNEIEILGFVEWIVLDNPSLRLKARLDTGANTASLHATDIEEFSRDDEEWVRFDLPLDNHKESDDDEIEDLIDDATLTFERPVERTVLIKRKGAESQRRYVVMMDFCINGENHEAQFSLTDRGRFSYPALLGRRFMGGQIVVDPADSFLAESECDYSELEEVAEVAEEDQPL